LSIAVLALIASTTLAHAQDVAGTDTEPTGLVPIRMTMLNGDPVISSSPTDPLPWEKSGERLGFVRHVTLAHIRRYPEMLDHKDKARDLAGLLLTDEARGQFIIETAPQRWKWIGHNEFEIERAFRSFVRQFGPVFADAAPQLPFDFWFIERSRLNRYDFDRGGYKVYGPEIAKPPWGDHNRTVYSGRELTRGILYVNCDTEVEVPDFLPMSEDRAESLTNLFANRVDGDNVYFGAHLTARRFGVTYRQSCKTENRTRDYTGAILIIEINSLGMYADAELTHLIHRYDVTTRADQPTQSRPVSRTEEPREPRKETAEPVNRTGASGHTLVQVTFINETALPVQVVWVAAGGQEQPYYVLQPGTSFVQPSYATHLWRFKHGDQVLGTYTVGPAAQQSWTIRP
jgi:hypothetical protein